MIVSLLNNSFIEIYSNDHYLFKATGLKSCTMFDSLKLNHGDTLNCRINVLWDEKEIYISYDMYIQDSMGGRIHKKKNSYTVDLTLWQMQTLGTIVNNLFRYWTDLRDEYLDSL